MFVTFAVATVIVILFMGMEIGSLRHKMSEFIPLISNCCRDYDKMDSGVKRLNSCLEILEKKLASEVERTDKRIDVLSDRIDTRLKEINYSAEYLEGIRDRIVREATRIDKIDLALKHLSETKLDKDRGAVPHELLNGDKPVECPLETAFQLVLKLGAKRQTWKKVETNMTYHPGSYKTEQQINWLVNMIHNQVPRSNPLKFDAETSAPPATI